MTTVRRLGLVVSVVAVGLFGQVFPAAASTQGPSAGTFRTTILSANYSFSPADSSQSQIDISVQDQTNQFNPWSGPSTITHETDVFIDIYTDSGDSGGCFIPDNASDVTLSFDLQSASLHTIITDATSVCQGEPVSFQLPLTVDVVWTASGPLLPVKSTVHSLCGGFHVQTLATVSSQGASATATLSPMFSDSFTGNQGTSLSSVDMLQHTEGTSPTTCTVTPAGGGSLAGPVPAGNYSGALQEASAFFTDDATQTSYAVIATNTSFTSNPKDGPSTSSNETDVQIFENIPDPSALGCFVLDAPSDFVVGNRLRSASLQTTITDSTAQCSDFPASNLTLPLTLDITWAATGPLASLQGNTQDHCLTNRAEGTALTQGTNATATVTFSGVSGPLSADFASIFSQSGATHAEGAIQPTC
jgi:hypothetical protein